MSSPRAVMPERGKPGDVAQPETRRNRTVPRQATRPIAPDRIDFIDFYVRRAHQLRAEAFGRLLCRMAPFRHRRTSEKLICGGKCVEA